jgi:uncharacterized protein YndB with AHSA1/START domain
MRPQPKTTELTVSRSIPASPADVYNVWIDPKSPGSPWFGPANILIDPRVDGLFYFGMVHEGRSFAHYGRFVELTPAAKIVHTWMSPATLGIETTVTITFEARGDATQVTLVHSDVPDDEDGRQHKDGWAWVLDTVAEAMAAKP